MSEPNIVLYQDVEEQSVKLSNQIVQILNGAQNPCLVLPGGSSPRSLIAELAQSNVNWNAVRISTTDERCVPTEHEQSNAGQIQKIFQTHGVEANICEMSAVVFPTTVTVLGMGEDGHIASLFPKEKHNQKGEKTLSVIGPKAPRERISFTMDALLETENLLLLVNGAEKRALCESILNGNDQDLPVAKLIQQAGERLTLHIVDQ